jgi:hypothetical protein
VINDDRFFYFFKKKTESHWPDNRGSYLGSSSSELLYTYEFLFTIAAVVLCVPETKH